MKATRFHLCLKKFLSIRLTSVSLIKRKKKEKKNIAFKYTQANILQIGHEFNFLKRPFYFTQFTR
jgi:hypothetical protein